MLRVYDQNHKQATITVNFSEPIGLNYDEFLSDKTFLYEKIIEERRNSEVEILTTILLMERFETKKYLDICT